MDTSYHSRQARRTGVLAVLTICILASSLWLRYDIEHSHVAVVPVVIGQQADDALATMHAAGFPNARLWACFTGYGTTVLAVTEHWDTKASAVGTTMYVGAKIVLWCDRQYLLLTN